MIGQTISHYRIIEKLGEGGMGVVYKAEDTALDRTVALKFLPSHALGNREDRERFVNEAKTAGALDHPSICTIHEISEEEGNIFIVMAYIEGETLEERMRAGLTDVGEITGLALQIAQGLREAHEKGIMHRDIKPANIMVTPKGQAKIMDFGLAKSGQCTSHTKEGVVVGTVYYMSPEQARGEKVDHRTDIWSLGVILYRMLAGELPFGSDYEQAVIYSIMNEEPVPITDLRPDISPELGEIVRRCMAKDPADRYQVTSNLLGDLLAFRGEEDAGITRTIRAASGIGVVKPFWRRPAILSVFAGALAVLLIFLWIENRWAPEPPSSVRKMLVVLPFQNLGPPEDEYFADGITNAIISRLAGIHGLSVISRQSAIQYKKSDKTIQEIGEELGVGYVLEGSVQRERDSNSGSKLRVYPCLVSVSDEINVWTDQIDADMTEVFQVQSEIAEQVARELDITLLEPERRSLRERPTANLEAYEYFLRGCDSFNRRLSERDSQEAVRMFEQAVELDSGFAVAWAALSRARVWLKWHHGHECELTPAKTAADIALRLAPNETETHMALGDFYYYGSRDYEMAYQHFSTVLNWRPSEVEAIASIGWIRRRQGRWEEAVNHLEDAIKLNPRDPTLMHGLGQTYHRMRVYEEAEQYLDRGISLVPHLPFSYIDKTLVCLSWDGDAQRARRVMEEALLQIDNTELLTVSPLMLVRILPGVYKAAWSELNLDSPGIDTVADSIYYHLISAELDLREEREEEAAYHYNSVRSLLEPMAERQALPGYLHSLLGLAYAGLGMKEEAVREGEVAVEMLPVSRDALSGTYQVERLAQIYVRIGMYDSAISQIDFLLSAPSRVSRPILRLDPIWHPLRNLRQYKEL